jgi:hypothetical protein
MEKFLKMIFSTENIRLAVILAAIVCSGVWLNSKMEQRFAAVDREFVQVRQEVRGDMASLRQDVREIKINDLAHLNAAIEALTFTLMKNGTLTPEDKNYIDSRLRSLP